MTQITAIILAAGASTRMGQQKVLMPWREFPTMGECTISRIKSAQPAEIVIVTSHQTDQYFADRFQNVVLNPHAENGMTSSIQTGVSHAGKNSDGFMICLADMPLISSETYALLMDRFSQADQPAIIQPVYEDQPGQPVIFSRSFRDEILAHQPPEGCREIVKANAGLRIPVEVGDSGILIDIDDEKTYREFMN